MKRAEHQPETLSVCVYAGIYYKVWQAADIGTVIPQHSHHHAHLTAILRGVVRVWRDDQLLGDFLAPATVKIPAYAMHRFETLTRDCVFACIHNADHLEDDEPAVAAEHHLALEG